MNVWYVKGDDESLVREKVSQLVRELAGDDAFAVEDFDGDDYELGPVVDACSTPPFLGDRRVVVARNLGRFRTEDVEPVLAYLTDPLPTTALILVAGGGEVSRKLLPAVKKVGTVIDTSAGTGRARASWLGERLAQAPVRLDAAAAARLGEHLGEDVSRVPGLLDTLAASYGEGARIGVPELEPFLGEAGGTAPWELTDSIDRGDTGAALSALRRLLDAGERHPLVVLATLHRHYGAMLRLDGAEVHDETRAAALLGMAPYPAKKVLQQGMRLGSRGVRQAILWLAQADLDLRGAQAWPPALVLEVLVARLCTLAGSRRGGPLRPPAGAGTRGGGRARTSQERGVGRA